MNAEYPTPDYRHQTKQSNTFEMNETKNTNRNHFQIVKRCWTNSHHFALFATRTALIALCMIVNDECADAFAIPKSNVYWN